MKKNYYIPMLSALLLSSCADKQKTSDKPLNIVFIMSDDHARQMVGCYEDSHIETPNIDRLAEEGLVFNNSFVCNSISGPSRAAILTGLHSHANGYTDNISGVAFDGSQQTVQQLLQEGGYQTAMMGKWHLGGTPTHFDHWTILPGQGDYYNPDFITPDGTIHKEGYVTNIITDLSIDWLNNQRDTSKPFCLIVHHKAAHRNWMSDTCNLKLYEDTEFAIPSTFYDNYENRLAAAKQEMSIIEDMTLIYDLKMLHDSIDDHYRSYYTNSDNTQGPYGRMNEAQKDVWNKHYQPIIDEFVSSDLSGKELAEWKFQRYMRDYAKIIKSLDDNIGRLTDELEELDLLDNTLIIYCSDQGFYMGEHGWFDKRFIYEESMQTPLVMRLPKGFKHRGNVEQLVQNIDYMPTILDIAGCEVPDDIHGVSLLPLLKGEKPKEWRKSLYYHFYEYPAEHSVCRHYGVRTERYKLIHFYNDIDSWELYDLQEDPHEMNNIYGEDGTEEITKELKEELKKLQIMYNVECTIRECL